MAVPVYVSAGTGKEILVYALLDNMSDACYASGELLSKLKAKASDTERNVTIHTINGSETQNIQRYDDVVLRGYSTDESARISVYRRDRIHGNKDQMPTAFKASELHHLQGIADQLPPDLNIPIGLLIGMDHPEIIQPLETRPAPAGKPFGVRTLFGWTMCGGQADYTGTNWATHLSHKRDTSVEILNLLERDFRETDTESYMSQDDIKFTEILKTSTEKSSDGNYIMPLPFRTEPDLPNNKPQAEKRLRTLLKKFAQEPSYHEEYRQFMEGMISSGHAEEAPSAESPGKV